jgi:pimeloyl-ACP methyl ester carboxylesterase
MSDLAYEGRGTSGPAVILLHGFPLDRGMWRGQLAGLGARARVVAPDLPGAGHSPVPGVDVLTIEAIADAVVGLCDALGFQRFVLAGLSMGGYVALDVARRHAGRLAGLVLMDTRAEPDTEEQKQERQVSADRLLAEGSGFFIEKSLSKWLSKDTLEKRPDVVHAVTQMARTASHAGMAATLRGLGARRDARPELAAIGVPTLVLCGDEDAITPPDGMRALAAAIAGATFTLVPGGHFAPFEHPAEVNAALVRFLGQLG